MIKEIIFCTFKQNAIANLHLDVSIINYFLTHIKYVYFDNYDLYKFFIIILLSSSLFPWITKLTMMFQIKLALL